MKKNNQYDQPTEVRCPKGHKVAVKGSKLIVIKCHRCKHNVYILVGCNDIHQEEKQNRQ